MDGAKRNPSFGRLMLGFAFQPTTLSSRHSREGGNPDNVCFEVTLMDSRLRGNDGIMGVCVLD